MNFVAMWISDSNIYYEYNKKSNWFSAQRLNLLNKQSFKLDEAFKWRLFC